MSTDAYARMELMPRRPRLVDGVVSRLRDSIIDGTIPAGSRLPQVTLAEQLGVSRTPLREALRVLESEGLLRTSDNNRTVEVVPVTADDLKDMYELREVIDGLAARLAAQNGFAPEIAQRVEFLLSEMAKSSDPYDPVRRNRAHAEFHEVIADASGNAKVRSFAPLIRTSSAALYLPLTRENAAVNLVAADPGKSYQQILDIAQTQHREIADAILARDPERAEAVARRHIQRTLALAPHFKTAED